ncbi:hypothetical protein CIK05_02635 [Bdellovibrio sp. qaytius]|nr:hypothetical protein CIK05_02635 [Bdellovibrio sp. qaytius]
MLKNFILSSLLVLNFSSCVTYIKNVSHDESKPTLTGKYKSEKLRIYFANNTEADLQNVELFRELILAKNMFTEVLLVRSEKIETCEGYCVLFSNKKSGLSIGEKLNMGATYLTLGIIPSRFTNEYALKNKYGQVEDIQVVNWVSLFLVFYFNNDTFEQSEETQLIKLQTLLNQADSYSSTATN